MKKIQFKRIVATVLFLAMMLGVFPPVELDFGNGFKLDLGGWGFTVPVSAAGPLTTSVTGLGATWTDASNSKGSANWSASGNTITGTATGYTQYIVSKKTITTQLTLTNNLGSEAVLKFSYNLSGGGSVSGISNNSYEGTLANGASLVIKLTSPSGSSTNTLTITDITLKSTATGNVTTTFKPADGGSYTVDGTAITATTELTKGAAESYAVVATPASGYKFFGWYNETTGKYLSNTASTSLVLPKTATVYPVFISADAALFGVSGTSDQYFDLNAACTAATNGSTKTVVLLNNGTLPAGKYTIPSDVTLLIPYNDANTVNKETPECHENAYTAPSVYRTLTMASGANITVNGALNVGGAQSAKMGNGYNGCVSGPYGLISMTSGSAITLNNGSNLYAWGYIIGSGSVTAENGATVYESFQLRDFRGGDVTSSAATDSNNKNTYHVFPMSQYYLQNIEVPLTLEAGAKENAYMSATITLAGVTGSNVPIISGENGGAMFQLSSGSITKDFNESTGRTEFKIDGTVSVSTISMTMQLAMIGSTTINSADFNLPIPGHMTVTALSGSNVTLAQDLALLPGSELYINAGATCIVAEGVRIVAYSWNDWISGTYEGGQAYFVHADKHYKDLWYSASKKGSFVAQRREKDALICVDGIVDASLGAVYTTSGGANIYSNGTGQVITTPGTETTTYQLFQTGSDDKTKAWIAIAITPAVLTNGNTTYPTTITSGAASGTTYYYNTDCDMWVTHGATGHNYDDNCDADCNVCGATRTPPHTPGAAATCTTAQTCTVCGAEIKAALGHKYTEEVTTAATCTENGVTTFTCTCGDTYTEEIAALVHKY
ncbi:MAG: hypothetical protein IJW00_01380, partial [Clostridia bacterium]|nr:hypothetical protein [Clostridia bacterium]